MKCLRAFILCLFCVSFLSLAEAAPSDFVGTWINVNPHSRGVVRIVVSPNMKMRMFGACTPSACDIGLAPLYTYGKSVEDADHRQGTAHYTLDFKEIDAKLTLVSRQRIDLEHFNRFTDNSNRQNYLMKERFRKATNFEIMNMPLSPEDFEN
ncbi:DUF2147 domain-containing protein [Bdellovibrio reynosensis]|uniref:DUF2147 domain-containing protein n=1 Tax=Bdellovibrio reynosensis TaxID=2835041 RepID=A0ABY4C8V7_9BACT|nr:hypothetical protein [Bdellovibrio reynosensis]UOF01308.1 hypothetical protein MNR06_16560 [Bdellovibrio reynosensis]